MRNSNQKFKADYQTALVICFSSIASTFLTSQGCLIAIKFSRGDFQPINFERRNCLVKLFQIGLLTCFGAIFLILFEILDHIRKIFLLPALLFGGAKGVQKIENHFLDLKSWLSSLNKYQLISLEMQRTVAQLIFENLPYTALLFVIKMKLMNCSEMLEGQASLMINISLLLTMVQIVQVICTSWLEAKALKETATGYLMSKMTANNKWIPFAHFIIKRQCAMNIHFGQLKVKIPILSKVFGIFSEATFEFTDWTLNYLLDELILWNSEMNGQEMPQKYHMIMTYDSLRKVSTNMLVHFIHNMPLNAFELELLLDWQLYYQEQVEKKLIHYVFDEANQVEIAYSPKGVSLLNICILNEKYSRNWPLKQMLNLILQSGKFAIQASGYDDPLVVAIQNNCFESINILNSFDNRFDLQMTDSSGTSVIGYLFEKIFQFDKETQNQMMWQIEKSIELQEIREFTNSSLNSKIDMHKQQFKNVGVTKKTISAWQMIFKSLRHHRSIGFGVSNLLDQLKKQGQFELTEFEKNTLFKSSVKLLQTYDDNAYDALMQLGEFCTKCQINIFTFIDKKGNRIDKRMMRAWSGYIKDNNIIGVFRPANEPHGTNLISKIMKLSIQTESINSLFDGNWMDIQQVLEIDQQNGDVLMNLQLKKKALDNIQNMLRQAKSQRKDMFPNFQRIIKKKIPSIQFKEQLEVDNQIEQQNILQKKMDTKIRNLITGNKFEYTERFNRTGNLKRNVGKDIQEELQFDQKLDQNQRDIIGELYGGAQNDSNKACGQIMRGILEVTLEWIAAADLYTDTVVLIQLIYTEHRAWTTITIFSMIAPFLSCQIPFLIFLKELIYRDKTGKIKLLWLGRLMLSPLMLIYMFLMDLVFLFIQAFIFPILLIVKFLTFGKLDCTQLIEKLDKVYEIMFEMQKLDVAGFRRMRTITQLTFETFLQLTLQGRMLLYFSNNKGGKDLGVDLSALVVSLLLSTSHALIEACFLYMEAQASKTSFLNYCIICFNGRFGWVPYNDHLMKTQIESGKKSTSKTEQSQQHQPFRPVKLDYENITSRILCLDIQVEFTFTNDTLLSLSKTLSSFSLCENNKQMPIIRFGSTIKQVSLVTLQGLLKVCQNRVKIDLNGTDLVHFYKKSPQKQLLTIQKVEEMSDVDKQYLFNLQKSKQYQLLQFLLSYNETLLKAKSHDKNLTMLQIVFVSKDSKLLELLCNLESDILREQFRNWEDSVKYPGKKQEFILKLLQDLDMDIWSVLATNTTLFQELWNLFNYMYFDKKQESDPSLFHRSLQYWHARFGPALPKEIVKNFSNYGSSSHRDFMEAVSHMYPDKIYVRVNEDFTSVRTSTAYCFATIRKKLVDAWDITSNGPKIDKELSEGVYNNPLNLSDFKISISDFKLITMLLTDEEHKQVASLTEQQIQRFDQIITQLKLDTNKWLYIGRTRLNDQTGNQIQCTYHGKDNSSQNPSNTKGLCPELDFPYVSKMVCDEDEWDYDTRGISIKIKVPEKCSFFTKFQFQQTDPQQKSYMSANIYLKDVRYYLEMYYYLMSKELGCRADSLELAQYDTNEWPPGQITNFRPMYMLGCQPYGGGYHIEFGTNSRQPGSSINRSPTFTFVYDYPQGTDLDKEQQELELQAREAQLIWKQSPKI